MTFLSHGAENVLRALSAYKRPDGAAYFPGVAIRDADVRFSADDNLHRWFLRCANASGGPEHCIIDDRIAVFGTLKWKNGCATYVNMQAIVASKGFLENYYCKKTTANCQYLRLELDLNKPGPLFKEPLPHIHSCPDGAPRFRFTPGDDWNLIAKFLEFLFLNYAYDKWLNWAWNVWKSNTAFQDGDDPMKTIIDAYDAEGKSQLLADRYATHLERLRIILSAEIKERSRHLAPISPSAKVMSYI